MKTPKSRFQAYVDPMLFGECHNYCEHHGVSVSAFIEQLLSDFFYNSKSDSKNDSKDDSSQESLNNLVSDLQSQVLELSDKVKNIEETIYLRQYLAQSTDTTTENQLESNVEPNVELYTELKKRKSNIESKKIENKSISQDCPRNTKKTRLAEFDEQGNLLGYFVKGEKTSFDNNEIQIYKRFDSAERAMRRICLRFPNKIFRILSSE